MILRRSIHSGKTAANTVRRRERYRSEYRTERERDICLFLRTPCLTNSLPCDAVTTGLQYAIQSAPVPSAARRQSWFLLCGSDSSEEKDLSEDYRHRVEVIFLTSKHCAPFNISLTLSLSLSLSLSFLLSLFLGPFFIVCSLRVAAQAVLHSSHKFPILETISSKF
jgi:hypothetical protein